METTLFDHIDDEPDEVDRVFSLKEGKRLKKVGMDRAMYADLFSVFFARNVAKYLAMERDDRIVTSNDIYRYCYDNYELNNEWLGPRSGSVWTDSQWEKQIDRDKADRLNQNAAEICRWRLRDDCEGTVVLPSVELVHRHIPKRSNVVLKPGVDKAVRAVLNLSKHLDKFNLSEQDLVSGFKERLRFGHEHVLITLARVFGAIEEAEKESGKC
jgi:hypothetical protein